MKKLLLSLLFVTGLVQAAPWDLNAQQYDQFGTSMINRLLPLPSSGTVNAFYMFDSGINLPKLGTLDSTLGWYSGQVMGLSASKNAEIIGKFTAPTGTTAQYVRGDGSLATFPAVGSGTVTSVGLTSTNLTIGGSPVTTSGNLTVALPNTGTAGTYDSVTTDALGRVTAGTNRSQSAQTRTLNSAYQISASRASLVTYSVRITTTASIGGNQDGDVILEIASDSGFTTNVQTLSITQNAQAISLAVVLNSVQTQTGVLSGFVPAGYYTRLRTVNNTGTPAFLYRSGQEVLL